MEVATVTTLWMLGVIGVMVAFGVIASVGIIRQKKIENSENNQE